MRYAIIVRTGPEQGEHMPVLDGQAVTGPVPDEAPPAACQALTKAGNPCQGKPGPDGYCAAHKQAEGGDGAAGDIQAPVVDADQAEEVGGGEEGGGDAEGRG